MMIKKTNINDLISFAVQNVSLKKWENAVSAFCLALEIDLNATLSTIDSLPESTELKQLIMKRLMAIFFEVNNTELQCFCVDMMLNSNVDVTTVITFIDYIKERTGYTYIVLDLYSTAYAKMGLFRTALKYLDAFEQVYQPFLSLLEDNDEDKRLLLMALRKVDAYLEIGDGNSARRLLSQIIMMAPCEETYLIQAFLYRLAGEYRSAEKSANMAIFYNNRSVSACFEKAFALKYSNDPRHFDSLLHVLELYDDNQQQDGVDYYIPFIYTYLKDRDMAISFINKKLDSEESAFGFMLAAEIHSLWNEPINSSIYFAKAINMGLPFQEFLREDPALQNLRKTTIGNALICNYINTISKIDCSTSEIVSKEFVFLINEEKIIHL